MFDGIYSAVPHDLKVKYLSLNRESLKEPEDHWSCKRSPEITKAYIQNVVVNCSVVFINK